jgi:hypothetical protein
VWTITDGGLLIKIDQHEPHYNCVWTITDGGLLNKIDQHEPHYNCVWTITDCVIVHTHL